MEIIRKKINMQENESFINMVEEFLSKNLKTAIFKKDFWKRIIVFLVDKFFYLLKLLRLWNGKIIIRKVKTENSKVIDGSLFVRIKTLLSKITVRILKLFRIFKKVEFVSITHPITAKTYLLLRMARRQRRRKLSPEQYFKRLEWERWNRIHNNVYHWRLMQRNRNTELRGVLECRCEENYKRK